MSVNYGPGNYGLDGTSAATAAPSARFLRHNYGYETDGVYWINLPVVGPTQIYCLMDPKWDGGGWMMILKSTTGTTFNYSANYWTTNNTLNPSDTTRNNADAKFHTMNYFPARDMLAVWPDISSTGGSISGTGYWTWEQTNFNGNKRIIPIIFFNSTSNLQISSGKSFSGWSNGVFSSQSGNNFYGFNFTYFSNKSVRWGFGWNNESDWGSDDVTGGIGLGTDSGSLSAGDYIGCCQDTTGINRSARVEVYVR
jgi:hypothetical protein